MEFEILNDILTSTVAQLFTQSENQKGPNWKTSSQMGQDKSEIPKDSASKLEGMEMMGDNPLS